MEKEEFAGDISTDGKEVDIMPTIELVECERTAYVQKMEAYLQKLKLMAYSEALKEAEKNLRSSDIIQEDKEFTERYPYSRMCAGQKG